ncbi:hypothetical protein PFISCL1PPCAC_20083, partial [Pristionchus fissidentatus]
IEMSLSHGRFLFFSLVLLSISSSSLAVICDSCEGEDCLADCEGDYCIQTTFNPKWGQRSLIDSKKRVKGCLKNDMIVKGLKPRCDQYSKSGKTEFCICNTKKCTSGQKLDKLKTEKIEKITCECVGAHCKDRNTCEGDVCTYVVDYRIPKKKTITKGCMDLSIPVFERRMIGSCMVPPLTGAMHHENITNVNDLFKIESCICATEKCNKKKPVTTSERELKKIETEKCDFEVIGVTGGKTMRTLKKKCTGEFCYRLNFNSTKGKMEHYDVKGCVTFNNEGAIDPIFSSGNCAEFTGGELDMKMCLKSENDEAMERLEAVVKNNEDESVEAT